MADSALPLKRWPGAVAAIAVAALVLAAFVAVVARAEVGSGLRASDWAAIRFTLSQAVFSAVLSVALAIPLARALARRQFWGRQALITLLGAPFLLPVIVAVMGLLAIFGRQGWLNQALGVAGFEPLSIYGFHGVVLAHVFFNMPLATRLVLQGWQDVPAEQIRLATMLHFSRGDMVRHLELPMLRRIVPGALALIFVICLTSFAVALILGGGPRATTIELAIYQAFRFDFDLGRAALLSALQVVVALGALLVVLPVLPKHHLDRGQDRPVQRWDQGPLDFVVIGLGAAFLLLPMVSILGQGSGALWSLPETVWRSALRSVAVGAASVCLLALLALPIATLVLRVGSAEGIGLLGLAMSPLMLGTGLFVILFPIADPVASALAVTACVNALMALPFAVRILVPGLRQTSAAYGRLAKSLGLRGWALWRIVLLPRLRRPLGFALGLGAALSVGDLGVIALFADPARATLPLTIEQLLGAYRVDDAAAASLVLAALSFSAFAVFDAWGRSGA